MGASAFNQVAFGKTAEEAYRNAVDRAYFERGHDPYNGTISTTHGFEMRPLGSSKFTKAALKRFENRAWFGKGYKEIKRTRNGYAFHEIIEGTDASEKWGNCHCVELPRSFAKGQRRGIRAYLFAGWAAE